VDIYQVIKEPHITEKANIQKGETNQVSFKVHRGLGDDPIGKRPL